MVRETNNHYSFEYNDYEEKPYHKPKDGKEDKNIKGVEFEVNDDNRNKVNELIDNLIDNKQICSKDTQDEYQRKILNATLSYDNTVHHEIVLQCEAHRNLMRKIKELNKFLNPQTIRNKHGTSMHIHMNKQYLYNKGINDVDMAKAGEMIAPVLLAMTNREDWELDRWNKTRSPMELNTPIIIRAKYIDNIELNHYDYDHHDGHYKMINVSNPKTIELRLFSNYHNFDYDKSKIKLELTDTIIDIAEVMQGKSYKDNYEIPMEIINDFFNKNQRRYEYLKYIKDAMITSEKEIKAFYVKNTNQEILKQLTNAFNINNSILGVLDRLKHIEQVHGVVYNAPIRTDGTNLEVISHELARQIIERR